jgi:hypothetical protein
MLAQKKSGPKRWRYEGEFPKSFLHQKSFLKGGEKLPQINLRV